MLPHRLLGGTLIAVILVTLAIIFSWPANKTKIGPTWDKPIVINQSLRQFTDYRTIAPIGGVIYYRLTVSRPTTLILNVNIPRSASPNFAPQAVMFEPDPQTIGPLLPIAQPPQTIAIVYPMTPPTEVFDPATQTSSTVRLSATPNLPGAGTYLLAVYNAGRTTGRYQLILRDQSNMMPWSEAWWMPLGWWHEQVFAGFSWLTLITPLLAALGAWLIYLRLDHHQLHVHKTYPPRPTKQK